MVFLLDIEFQRKYTKHSNLLTCYEIILHLSKP